MDTLENPSSLEKKMMDKAIYYGQPLTGSMELLPLCNLNCDMCFVRLSRKEMEAQGRLRSGDEWLSLGKEMVNAGTLFLLLTGGEPLLHPEFKKIYLGLRSMGLILTLNTNATLIDDEWADFFGKYKPRRVNITLYGGSNDTYDRLCHTSGGFDRVVDSIRMLRQRGVDVHLAGSITPRNVNDIDQMISFAKSLDVVLRMDTYMMPGSRERSTSFQISNRLLPEDAAKARIRALRGEMGEECFRAYRKMILDSIDSFESGVSEPCMIACKAGRCSFTINWQGMLRPCVIMTSPEVNVFEVGFTEAWKQIRNEFLKVRYCQKCSNCALRVFCRSCAAAAKLESGEFLGVPEYLCRYAEESVRLLRLTLEESENE